ncbi:hypothetical protein ABNQ38_03235 [Azospirillum sp. A29]|uniref:hypothetical protein n=1 Tax=Azospirillum sp. A29 TaxID=3160606 RepID=UPI00366CC12A
MRFRRVQRWVGSALVALLLLLTGIAPDFATAEAADSGRLLPYLAKLQPSDLVPGADRFGQPTPNAPTSPSTRAMRWWAMPI